MAIQFVMRYGKSYLMQPVFKFEISVPDLNYSYYTMIELNCLANFWSGRALWSVPPIFAPHSLHTYSIIGIPHCIECMILTSMIITILAPFKEIYRPQRHSRYGLLDILDGKSAYIAFIVLLCMYSYTNSWNWYTCVYSLHNSYHRNCHHAWIPKYHDELRLYELQQESLEALLVGTLSTIQNNSYEWGPHYIALTFTCNSAGAQSK